MKFKNQKSKIKNDVPNSQEVEILKNQLARALADYDNLSRRVEGQRTDLIKFASQTMVIRLLPILDNLESAQKHLNDQGLAIAISEFKKLLSEEGLEEIQPKVKEKLDPTLHEVIESIKAEGQHGEIAEVVLPGWKFRGGNVVRVAKVKVFQKSS